MDEAMGGDLPSAAWLQISMTDQCEATTFGDESELAKLKYVLEWAMNKKGRDLRRFPTWREG